MVIADICLCVAIFATVLKLLLCWPNINLVPKRSDRFIGVGLVAGQHRKVPQFHLFYGFVAIISVGLLYSYRQQMRYRIYLLYGGGGLFVMGLGIRAVLVAKGS